MTVITGSLAVTDPGVTIERWRLGFLETEGLNIEEEIEVISNGSTPVDWSVNLYSATCAYMLAITPKFDAWWRGNYVFEPSTLIMPYEKPGLFLYELTGVNPVNNDPYWDDVVLRITGDTGITDDKGHALTLGDTPAYWASGTWNAPYDGSYNRLGSGSIQFHPDAYKGPVTIDHADLDLGTGDFTLEFWVQDYYSSTRGTIFCYGVPGSGSELKLEGKRFEPLRLWLGATELFASTNFPGATWERWILARQDGSLYVIRNGTVVATIALAGAIAGPLYLGALPAEPQAVWTGMLFDVTLTKAHARQIATHTPWQLKSLGPQTPKTGLTEPDWPTELDATVTDGAYIWTARHRTVAPIIQGPIWPVEPNV